MKILLVSHSSNLGGTERCFGSLLEHLVGQGHEVTAAYPDGAMSDQWEALCGRIPYAGSVPSSFRPKGYVGWLLRGWWGTRALRVFLRTTPPNVVVTSSSVLTAPVGIAVSRGLPVVAFVRERIEPGWVRKRLWRYVAREASSVVVITEQLAEEFQAVTGATPHLIHDGVSVRTEPRSDTSGVPRVAFYGGFDPNKGGDIFVRAVAAMPRDERAATFVYYGVAKESRRERVFERQVRELACELGLSEEIEFAETTDFEPTFSKADVVVIASWNEALPLVALQAMGTGAPVIASAVGGLTRLLGDTGAGALFPAGEWKALAQQIGRFVDEPELRWGAGERARALVAGEYELSQSLNKAQLVIQAAARPLD